MLRDDFFAEQISFLVAADASSKTELAIRRSFVFVFGIGMWIIMSDPIFLVWGFGYSLGDIAYVNTVRRVSANPTAFRFVVAHVSSLLLGLVLGSMSIYLALIQDGVLYFPAASILIALALHCLSNHERISVAAYVDFLIIAVTTIGVTLAAAVHAPTTELGIVIAAGGAAVLIFFAHSWRKMIARREDLHRRIAQEQQGEKMKALGQLTSGVAHDFNNLLTVIGGNIELAQLLPMPADARPLLLDAQNATKSAALLVLRLLAYARKSTLSAQVHLCDQVFNQIDALAKRLLPANICFRVSYPGWDLQLFVDATMLETALLNLIVNARDAIGDQPGEISVFAINDRAMGRVHLCVTDTGPGMSAEALKVAVDPFFTTKGVGEGSGLGLSMVKGFAEQSGGALVLENRSGLGLRATLTVPARDPKSRSVPL